MKKLIALIFCLIACLSATGCALLGGNHDNHKFKKKWESNAVYHWHDCKYSDCNVKDSKEMHDYKDGKCTVCGFKEQTFGEYDSDLKSE